MSCAADPQLLACASLSSALRYSPARLNYSTSDSSVYKPESGHACKRKRNSKSGNNNTSMHLTHCSKHKKLVHLLS